MILELITFYLVSSSFSVSGFTNLDEACPAYKAIKTQGRFIAATKSFAPDSVNCQIDCTLPPESFEVHMDTGCFYDSVIGHWVLK